ncbi:MAG TPA: toprim domain-containing protein [Stellaceae bacterium]|nr:toprim domain-containing protein [Stellaceae bacterium]
MKAADIAQALGAARRHGTWWSCRCPAHQDRSPSLSICDGDKALVVRCWAGCDARDVLGELRRRGLLIGNARTDRRVDSATATLRREQEARDLTARTAHARQIWERAGDASGTLVVTYLATRGISVPVPPSLRWEPYCWNDEAEDWLPAMIAAITNVTGELTGIHRTYLRSNGCGKADIAKQKMMLGAAAGGAVRLAPAAEMLMVGEGLESSLAAAQATELPAWAALSTSGLKSLVLPPRVKEVIILADNDVSGAGLKAAQHAAARWQREERRVKIAMPPEAGTDFADMLLGQSRRLNEVGRVGE